MASGTIEPGVTSTITQPLWAPDTLVILGGTADGGVGGTGLIPYTNHSRGSISVHGGAPANSGGTPGLGGQLDISGLFQNGGQLELFGGAGTRSGFSDGGAGGTLTNTGDLSNGGVLLLDGGGAGGASGFYGQGGQGSVLENSYRMRNDGTVAIGGGAGGIGYLSGAGTGATLSNDGVLINTGTLSVAGGTGGRYGYAFGGTGGVLNDAGVLVNTGDIGVGGGHSGHYFSGSEFPGYGGRIAVSGSMLNSGTMTLAGGISDSPESYPVEGASLDVSGTMKNQGVLQLLAGAGFSYGASAVISGVLIDTGRIAIAGATDTYGMGAGQLSVAAGGRLQIALGGTLANAGTFSNDGAVRLLGGGIGGAGTVINDGRMVGEGVIQAGTFTNTGVVVATGGRLAVSGEIGSGSGAGTFAVQHGATLSLDGGITGNEFVVLAGQDARLQVSAATAGVRVISPQGGGMEVLGGGAATLNAQDTNLFVKLAEATNLTLSTMRFVAAVGSSGDDQITALASAQVLTGGLGTDTLTGAAASGDLFRDTAAGLNGDTLVNFAGTDVIDLTDIAAGGVSLGYQQNGAIGTLSVSNGGTSTSITLAGSFAADQFKAGSDGSGGVAIHLQG